MRGCGEAGAEVGRINLGEIRDGRGHLPLEIDWLKNKGRGLLASIQRAALSFGQKAPEITDILARRDLFLPSGGESGVNQEGLGV